MSLESKIVEGMIVESREGNNLETLAGLKSPSWSDVSPLLYNNLGNRSQKNRYDLPVVSFIVELNAAKGPASFVLHDLIVGGVHFLRSAHISGGNLFDDILNDFEASHNLSQQIREYEGNDTFVYSEGYAHVEWDPSANNLIVHADVLDDSPKRIAGILQQAFPTYQVLVKQRGLSLPASVSIF